MAAMLRARSRWVVTGTPIGRGGLGDLHGLLRVLRHDPLSERALWDACVQRPVLRGARLLPDRLSMPCLLAARCTAPAPWKSVHERLVRVWLGIQACAARELSLLMWWRQEHAHQWCLLFPDCAACLATDEPRALARLEAVLKPIMWRNSKASVGSELLLPPRTLEVAPCALSDAPPVCQC